MRSFVVLGLVVAVMSSAHAASPAVSRGEQLLAIGFDECIARARAAFPAEGYTVKGYDDTSFVFAQKGIHTAYITCSPAPSNKIWVNVFVASYTQAGHIPGSERLRLQTRMAQGLMPRTFSGTWSVTKDWRTLMLEQRGDQVTGRYLNPPGALHGTVIGDTLVFEFKDDAGPYRGRAYMRLTSDKSFEGRWCLNECDPKVGAAAFTGTRP
jgi:hypothetical protein